MKDKKYFELARKVMNWDFTDEEIQEFFNNGTLEIKDNKIYCYTSSQNISIDIETAEIKKEIINEDEFIKRAVKAYDEVTTSDLQGIVEVYVRMTHKNLDIRTEFELSDKLLKKIYEQVEE